MFLNIPQSANVTLTGTLNWGVLGPAMTAAEAMSATAGLFCYRCIDVLEHNLREL